MRAARIRFPRILFATLCTLLAACGSLGLSFRSVPSPNIPAEARYLGQRTLACRDAATQDVAVDTYLISPEKGVFAIVKPITDAPVRNIRWWLYYRFPLNDGDRPYRVVVQVDNRDDPTKTSASETTHRTAIEKFDNPCHILASQYFEPQW